MEKKEEIKEIEILSDDYEFLCITDEEIDSSVNYYNPFCICFENKKDKSQAQIFLDYENLIVLAEKLKPYYDSHIEREKI